MSEANTNGPLRFLSVNDVLDRIGVSRASLVKMRKMPDFPKQVRIAERRIGFLEHEVTEWMRSRVALRDQEVA